MTRYLILAGLAAALVLPAAPARADNAETIFQRLDLDGDGFVDANELAALRARVFAEMDLDRDAVLTRAEFVEGWVDRVVGANDPRRQALIDLRNARFAEIDLDGDGAVPREDYVAGARDRFAAADADGDGRLDLEELRAAAPE